MIKRIAIVGVLATVAHSCTVVKEYDKVFLNDKDMSLSDRKIDGKTGTFQSYREAASGANGGKTGGGCGCN